MSFSEHYAHAETPHDKDLATLSNYLDIRTNNIDLTWEIDWVKKTIAGDALLQLEATKDVEEVVLDTNHLEIYDVAVDGKKAVCIVLPSQ